MPTHMPSALKAIAAAALMFLTALLCEASDPESVRLKCQHMADTYDYTNLRQESARLHTMARRANDKRLEAYACYYLAASELKTASVREARIHALEADSLASLIHNDTVKASALNVLGIIANEYDSNNALALGYYLSALDCASRSENKRTTAGIYSNISLLFTSHNDTAGLRYCRESYRLSLQTGKPQDTYYPLCNLATVYLLRNDTANAYHCAMKAAKLSRQHQLHQPELAQILLGSVLRLMGRRNDALARLDNAIASLKLRNPASSLLAQAYFEKARILSDMREYSASNSLCTEALACSSSLGNRSFVSDMYALMAANYEALGDKPAALAALKNENNVIKSTVKVQDATIHREIERTFDLLQKEKQLGLRDMQISLHRQRIGILVGLLAVIAIILSVVLVSYRKEKRLNRRIVSQFKEHDSLEQKLMEKSAAGRPAEETQKSLFEQMTRLMEDEKLYLDKRLSRDYLAERLHTNRTYISKIVKDNTGLTLPQWVNQFRVKQSRMMLADPAMESAPIKEIADKSGFANVSTFNVVFKETVGLSPSAYRKEALQLSRLSEKAK